MIVRLVRLMLFSVFALVIASCGGGSSGSPSQEQRTDAVSESDGPSVSTQPALDAAADDTAAVSVPARSVEALVTGSLGPISIIPSVGLPSSDPVWWGDLLILGTADGTVTARSADADQAASVTPSWETRYAAPIDAMAVGPSLLVVAAGPVVEAINPVSGASIWRTDLDGARVTTRMTMTPRSVYLGRADGEVVAIAIGDGTVRWRARLDGSVVDQIPVADGIAYAATEDGTLFAISAESGEVLWSRRTNTTLAAGPAVGSGRIAIATVEGDVNVFGADGSLSEWRIDAEPVLVAPIWYDGGLVVVDGAGTVFLVSESGELQWRYELTAHLAGVPARIGHALVLGEAGGGLVSVDLRSGGEISRVSFGAPLRGEAALFAGSLWWVLGDGSIREVGFDAEYREAPLLTAEGSWVLPETGTFRLEDERVSLTMRSGRDAVFEITVTSAPSEDLVLRVVSADGAEVATNMGKVALSRTVRVALDAGLSYELRVSRPNPRGEITISVQTRQLQ